MRTVTITSPFGPTQEFKQLEDPNIWELTLIGRGGATPGGFWRGRDVVNAVREAVE